MNMLSNFRKSFQLSVRGISLMSRLNKKFQVHDNNDFVYKVLNSRIPVVVNFHADWCEPCKMLKERLEELIEPMEDLDLAIVDVESNPELVHTFEVKAVPAVITLSNGIVVDKFIGLVEASMIENLIHKLVNKEAKRPEKEEEKKDSKIIKAIKTGEEQEKSPGTLVTNEKDFKNQTT